MNNVTHIFVSSATRNLCTGLALLLLPIFSMAQERIIGNGNWETAYDFVYPDGTRGGLIRQHFLSESACLSTRNRIVQEAQASFEGIDQQYEPHDGEWQAMEARANLTPCRNISTGVVSAGNLPGGFDGERFNSGVDCVDMTRADTCNKKRAGSEEGYEGSTASGTSPDSMDTELQALSESMAAMYGLPSGEMAEVLQMIMQMGSTGSADTQLNVLAQSLSESYDLSPEELQGLLQAIITVAESMEDSQQ